MYKHPPSHTRNAKNPRLNHPSQCYTPPGPCTWKLPSNSKITQSKNCTVTQILSSVKELLIVPNDCSQKVSQFVAVGIVHSSILAGISLVHIDNVLGWLSFRKIYVASWQVSVKPCCNFKLLSRHKFPFNYKLAQRTFETPISLPV